MERTNIADILRYAPTGLELWSDAHGVVKLEKVDTNSCYPIFVKCGKGAPDNFRDNGAFFYDESSFYPCILWPSKDHRRVTDPDLHSYSWLTTQELRQCFDDCFKQEDGSYKPFSDYVEWLGLVSLCEGIESTGEYECRVVFAFDN